jgi:hypothetical protein
MPTIGAKVSQQELEAITEYANQNGITISNLIRMLLVREVTAPKILKKHDEGQQGDNSESNEKPAKITLMEMLTDSRKKKSQLSKAGS